MSRVRVYQVRIWDSIHPFQTRESFEYEYIEYKSRLDPSLPNDAEEKFGFLCQLECRDQAYVVEPELRVSPTSASRKLSVSKATSRRLTSRRYTSQRCRRLRMLVALKLILKMLC